MIGATLEHVIGTPNLQLALLLGMTCKVQIQLENFANDE